MKNLKYWILPVVISILALVQVLFAQIPTPVANRVDIANFGQHTHTSAATITITPGAAGSDTQFIYITGIDISNCATGTAVTAAAPTYITTTNINNDGGTSVQFQLGSGVTAGQCTQTPTPNIVYPIKSQTAGAAVTFVMPAFATNQVAALNVYYRKGR